MVPPLPNYLHLILVYWFVLEHWQETGENVPLSTKSTSSGSLFNTMMGWHLQLCMIAQPIRLRISADFLSSTQMIYYFYFNNMRK